MMPLILKFRIIIDYDYLDQNEIEVPLMFSYKCLYFFLSLQYPVCTISEILLVFLSEKSKQIYL